MTESMWGYLRVLQHLKSEKNDCYGLEVSNLIYKFTTSVCLWRTFWGVGEGTGRWNNGRPVSNGKPFSFSNQLLHPLLATGESLQVLCVLGTGEGLTGCDGGQQGRAGQGRVPAGPVRAGHGRGADWLWRWPVPSVRLSRFWNPGPESQISRSWSPGPESQMQQHSRLLHFAM
jgi:hypothetical protein